MKFFLKIIMTCSLLLAIAGCQSSKNNNPYIKLISPNGGEVWIEGNTYEISWESTDVGKVIISVAMGGKDLGTLSDENEKIDAKSGKFVWTIPRHYVSGFGIAQSNKMKIMIRDAKDHTLKSTTNNFTIKKLNSAGFSPQGAQRFRATDYTN